jgi:hypothetical protein
MIQIYSYSLFFITLTLATSFLFAAECPDGKNAKFHSSAQSIISETCLKTKKSTDCQDLYKELEKTDHKKSDYELSCAANSKSADFNWKYAAACGGGAFDQTFGKTGKQIGEYLAQLTIDSAESKELQSKCDNSIEIKKAIYRNSNLGLPKHLEITPPDDTKLNSMDCNQIYQTDIIQKRNHKYQRTKQDVQRKIFKRQKLDKEDSEYLDWQKSQKKYETDIIADLKALGIFTSGLYTSAIEGLKKEGVKLECYNNVKQTELICGWLGEIAATIGGPAYLARRQMLKKSAGLVEGEGKVIHLPDVKTPIKPEICKPKCPDWLKEADFNERVRSHIKPHLQDLKKQEQILMILSRDYEKIKAEVLKTKPSAGSATGTELTLSKKDFENLLRTYNTDSEKVFRGQITSTFPKDFKIEELFADIKKGKVEMQEVPKETPKDNLQYQVQTEGGPNRSIYNMVFCDKEPGCEFSENGTKIQVKKGDLITVYPECGPGVKAILGVGLLAARLRDRKPITEMMGPKPCE